MGTVNFSGIASGIDGNSIIEATVEARKLTKAPLQKKVDINNAENEAIDKLRLKLVSFEDKLRSFATFRGTSVSKTIVSSDESKVTAAVSGDATPGTISIDVLRLASSGRITFDNTYPSPTSKVAPGLSGPVNIDITVGSGASQQVVSVSVDDKTTIAELTTKIGDALPGEIGSSLVNIGTEASPQYKLMISSVETGVELGSLSVTVPTELQSLGVFTSNQTVNAQDAQVRVEGIGIIERSRNVINDLLPGVSLELKQLGSGINLRVSSDPSKTTKRVDELVLALNEIISYVQDESKITRVNGENGVSNKYGVLARTRVDNQLITSIRTALSQVQTNIGGGSSILSDIGVNTTKAGTLEFKTEDFEKALADSPEKVSALLEGFADKIGSTTGVINNYTSFDGLLAQAKKSNEQESTTVSDRMIRIDASIEKQREYLVKLFANLEQKIGRLNSNSTALSSLSNLNKK